MIFNVQVTLIKPLIHETTLIHQGAAVSAAFQPACRQAQQGCRARCCVWRALSCQDGGIFSIKMNI